MSVYDVAVGHRARERRRSARAPARSPRPSARQLDLDGRAARRPRDRVRAGPAGARDRGPAQRHRLRRAHGRAQPVAAARPDRRSSTGQAANQPRVSGRVRALAVHPDGERIYAAAAQRRRSGTRPTAATSWRSIGGFAATDDDEHHAARPPPRLRRDPRAFDGRPQRRDPRHRLRRHRRDHAGHARAARKAARRHRHPRRHRPGRRRPRTTRGSRRRRTCSARASTASPSSPTGTRVVAATSIGLLERPAAPGRTSTGSGSPARRSTTFDGRRAPTCSGPPATAAPGRSGCGCGRGRARQPGCGCAPTGQATSSAVATPGRRSRGACSRPPSRRRGSTSSTTAQLRRRPDEAPGAVPGRLVGSRARDRDRGHRRRARRAAPPGRVRHDDGGRPANAEPGRHRRLVHRRRRIPAGNALRELQRIADRRASSPTTPGR